MNKRSITGLLVVWILATTFGGAGLIMSGTSLLMFAGAILIIFGLVSLMPLFSVAIYGDLALATK